MAQPTVYLDTNILSVLYYRGRDLGGQYHREITVDWWVQEREHFRLVCSSATEIELRQGRYPGQDKAVAACRRLPYLPITGEVRQYAGLLGRQGIVPVEKPGDAMQLALATIHHVDYLLTWNYAHLANVGTQSKLEALNVRHGHRSPLLVSPETIPKVQLGQSILRKPR
jgi:hypothetical protein